MKTFKLRIITPEQIVKEEEIESITVPTVTGEITVLHNHVPLFSVLKEGICKYIMNGKEEHLAIGSGYLEVSSDKVTNLLVSTAYGQEAIDENLVKEAQSKAKGLLSEAKTDAEREEALMQLRRSTVDLKLLNVTRRKRS